jgi:hypothetical protein
MSKWMTFIENTKISPNAYDGELSDIQYKAKHLDADTKEEILTNLSFLLLLVAKCIKDKELTFGHLPSFPHLKHKTWQSNRQFWLRNRLFAMVYPSLFCAIMIGQVIIEKIPEMLGGFLKKKGKSQELVRLLEEEKAKLQCQSASSSMTMIKCAPDATSTATSCGPALTPPNVLKREKCFVVNASHPPPSTE